MAALPGFGATAKEIGAYIDHVRRSPSGRDILVQLLDERSAVFAGRGASESEWLRGYLLASFEITGTPAAATPFILEELETGRYPYAVAGAAKAVRGGDGSVAETVPLLLAAIERMSSADDTLYFGGFLGAPEAAISTTVLSELVRTLTWLGPRAHAAHEALRSLLAHSPSRYSAAVRAEFEKAVEATAAPAAEEGCCCRQTLTTENICSAGRAAPPPGPMPEDLCAIVMQDQDGRFLTYGEAVLGRAAAVAFFYTRCMNPEKCSLTVTRLGRLQRRLRDKGLSEAVNVAGITYDPAFDLPERLHAYGNDRGMAFDSRNRLLRTTGPFEALQQWFNLGVGYGPVTVNRHRLDFFILDETGGVATAFQRRLWDDDAVIRALVAASGRKICASTRHHLHDSTDPAQP